MDSTKIPWNDFLDVLFDGRNKDYGAYELRARYDNRVRNAIIGTTSIVLVLIGGYVVSNGLMAANHNTHPVLITKETVLKDVKLPDPDPVIPPPPATLRTPLPQAATIDFVSPVITDQDVLPDEAPPRIKDTESQVVGSENKIGIEDGAGAELVDVGTGTNHVVDVPPAPDNKGPLTFVEIMPQFPGGQDALFNYLRNHIRYPAMAQENNIEGIVTVQFVVNRDGSISDVKLGSMQKGGGLDEEAMRVVRNMPKWKPGRQNGQNVAVIFNLPVNFRLSHE
ncbi:MAG TPA: energy transducer TonB [Chitinophaga sp.]|uniref:energy transducer TonB n=1 Tax=Chitinophaga sp. TaxID=1869181 RepID=UPI002C5B9F1F|nr:energy transducer TonB [Chitinophaga sp.]HVI46779.1 energy transducer TonB [Chitinophaga sp.]